eukprot:TRINITY_DN24855_c0_g1_i1.p2 TRINITY_DN24855_c0_g1~~TRINITY_DN24855_c0_g1_i1.p2  ORF type:complete len:234 (+),score=62.10 TRINITY_DN24855_c0_g1_i1:99-800(+)
MKDTLKKDALTTSPHNAISGGDVVCREVREGDQVGLSCSLVSWCVGQRCLTVGPYQMGDVVYKASYTKGLSMQRVGTVGEKLRDDLPPESAICMVDIDEGVSVDAWKLHSRKIFASKDPITMPSQFNLEATEPATGRTVRHFGNYDLTASPPQPGVMPIACNMGRLKSYHQGSVFRFGNQAMCIYNGTLETDSREYAACFETSRLCAFHPEWCQKDLAPVPAPAPAPAPVPAS